VTCRTECRQSHSPSPVVSTSRQTENTPPPVVPARQRSLALDGWRAVACLLVLFHHTGFFLGHRPIVVWGFTGVHLFFVLSGYLLYRPLCKAMLAGAPFDVRDFYIRRLLRIYPAYLLALAAFTVARYVTRNHPPSAYDLLTHLVFAYDSYDVRRFFGIAAVFWTLAIEAQFYVILPLISILVYRAAGRHARVAIAATPFLLFVVGLISRAIELHYTTGSTATDDAAIRFHRVFSFLDLFACGMVVAALELLTTARQSLRSSTGSLLAVAGLAMFLAANAWCSLANKGEWMMANDFRLALLFPPLLCGGLALVLHTVIRSESPLSRWLAVRPLVFLGEISYGIYLFHVLVQLLCVDLFSLSWVASYTWRTFLWGLISLFPTVLVAAVCYRLVEEPCLRVSLRYKHKKMLVGVGGNPAASPVSLPLP
jgi:peptidoglycan/LPS O-acetylase OafA/YrhL